MKNNKLIIAMFMAGVLSACSMAPTYERPDAPVSEAFSVQSNETNAQAISEIGWKSFFKDARLQALIAAGLENNRNLRIAVLRIEEARALYGIQFAARLPSLSIDGSGTRARTPAELTDTGVSTLSERYDANVALASYELDFFGRVKSLSDAALADYLATEEARRSAHITLISEIAKAYFTEEAYAMQLDLAQKAYDTRVESYDLAKKRFDVGATSKIDLVQYNTLMQTAKVSLVTLKRQRAQAENALLLLVGTSVKDLPEGIALTEQVLLTTLPPALPSDMLNNRPDILAAEQNLLSANANIGAARAAFFPSISLTANTGSASTSLSGLFESGTNAWTFIPQISIPIFQGGANVRNLDLAWARKNIAVATYEQTIQVAFSEVNDALISKDLLDQQVEAQTAVRTAEEERLKLAKARYENGIDSSLLYLDAQREFFDAEQALVQTHLLKLSNAVDVYRSLGGGVVAETVKKEEKI